MKRHCFQWCEDHWFPGEDHPLLRNWVRFPTGKFSRQVRAWVLHVDTWRSADWCWWRQRTPPQREPLRQVTSLTMPTITTDMRILESNFAWEKIRKGAMCSWFCWPIAEQRKQKTEKQLIGETTEPTWLTRGRFSKVTVSNFRLQNFLQENRRFASGLLHANSHMDIQLPRVGEVLEHTSNSVPYSFVWCVWCVW